MKIVKTTLKIIVVLLVVGVVSYLGMMSGAFHTPASFHDLAADRGAPGAVLVVGATQNTAALDALGVEKVVMDAMDEQQVREVIVPGRYVAMVSTVGTAARDRPERRNMFRSMFEGPARMDPAKRPDYVGNRNLIDASPVPIRRGQKDVVLLKNQAEDHLRASGLDYTIIRPGGLGPSVLAATGTARLTEDPASLSYISRKDLARLVVDSLGDPSTAGHTYTAWDRSRRNLWNLFID